MTSRKPIKLEENAGKSLSLGRHKVGAGASCFVIAEIGINHGGDISVARRLIDEAAAAGASAVKFQTYLTEKRVAKDNPVYGILKKCELSFEAQRELHDYAEKKVGVTFFSTPFDAESVDFLESIGIAFYKIASFDAVNLSLLRRVAQTGKPVIMSTGMANHSELDEALKVFSGVPVVLLHCVSSYPTPPEAADIGTIRTLRERYPHIVGYSDHTIGIEVPALAIAAGAEVIEKHFTLDSTQPGPDHSLSADPKTFRRMVEKIHEVERIRGGGQLRRREVEAGAVVYRRPTK